MEPIRWDIEISVLTNRRVWLDLLKVALIVYMLVLLLLGIPLGVAGEWQALGKFAIGFPVLIVGLFLIGILGLTALTGNRFRLHYEIDDDGATCTVTDQRARAVGRGAALIGMMMGSLATTGAGLATIAGESRVAFWSRIGRARYHRRRHVIDLQGSWRSLLVIYCPPELYERVAKLISERLAADQHLGTAKPGPSRLSLLLWSAAVILACLPLFALPFPFRIGVAVPIFLLCFAVGSVWLVRALGYAVLLGVAAAVYQIVAAGLQRHKGSIGTMHYDYSGFDSLRGDRWGAIIIAGVGLVFLTWFAIRTVRGRGPAAFERDITPD